MKEKRIALRVSDDEYLMIKQYADNAGLTVSQYLRSIAKKKPVNPKPSLIDMDSYNALRGIANNLNQIARHANGTGFVQVEELNKLVEEFKTRVL